MTMRYDVHIYLKKVDQKLVENVQFYANGQGKVGRKNKKIV